MGQALLWGCVHLVGLALAAGCGWARRPLLAAALGFPLGLASAGFATSSLLWLGLPHAAAMTGAAASLIAAGGLAAWRRRADVDRRAITAALAAVAITAALAAALDAYPYAVVTERGHAILLAATAIHRDADSLDFIWNGIQVPPVFQAVMHAAAPLVGRPFLAALSPLCGLACALLLGLGGAALAGRWTASRAARVAAGAAAAAALCSFLFVVQSTSIDVHAAAAALLLGFVVAHAIAEEEAAPPSVMAELCLLLGLALQGFTFTVAASALLVVAYGRSRRDPAALRRPVALYTAAITGWHLCLWQAIGDWGREIRLADALVVTAVPLAACAALVLGPRARGAAARRLWPIAAAAVLVVGAGLATGWGWGSEPADRGLAIARWIGRHRPGLSDAALLGLAALCAALARGPGAVTAAAAVVVLFAAQVVLDAGGAIDPRELAGPLRVAAAPAALLLIALTGVRLLAGRDPAASPAPDPAPPPAPARVVLVRAAPALFGAAIALLAITNLRHHLRVYRIAQRDDRQIFSSMPASLSADHRQFAYYYVGEVIPGATVVIPSRLAAHALFFRRLGRVDVEIVSAAPRVHPGAVGPLARLRTARRPIFYERAGQSEPIDLVFFPRSRRYVLAEAGSRGLQLVAEPLFFWLADPGHGSEAGAP